MNGTLDHNSGKGVTTRYFITTGTVICPAGYRGDGRDQYIHKCLKSNTVSVMTQRGEIIHDCLLLTPRAATEDGFLEMVGIPRAKSKHMEQDTPDASQARSGLFTGTAVIVFPLDGSLHRAAVMPIAGGIAPEMFRLFGEHQQRDRHVTPHSTFEQMIDGEGGFNLWFKTYTGDEEYEETLEAVVEGASAKDVRTLRESRLKSTTRVRVSPNGKTVITLAKNAQEIESTKNLEEVHDQFSALDAFDNDDTPHIVIDPDNDARAENPKIHVDSGNATIDMDKDKVKIKHKVNGDTIIMENGKIRITVGNDGIVELNGGDGHILSTKNLPACLVTGTPFLGSLTERTKR